MKEETKEAKEKVWIHVNGEKAFLKTYLKVIVAETETTVWTYDEEKIVVEVDNDGTLHIEDDRQWISVMNLKALEMVKEAIDVAIQIKKNNG